MSAQPGLIPRMDGMYTKYRVIAVSIFLDSYSGHSYPYFQTSIAGKETGAAKAAYKLIVDSHGVKIRS